MTFNKDFLEEEEWDETVSNRIVGHSRWAVQYETIFKHDDKFYKTTYSVGATEYQDEGPYDNEGDEVDCPEVVPVEVTVTEYREKA